MNIPPLDDMSLRSASLKQLQKWKANFEFGTIEYAEIDLEIKRRKNYLMYGNVAAEDIHQTSLNVIKKYVEKYGSTNAIGYEQVNFFD